MKRSWLIAGAVVGCLSGAAVGACGSSSGAGGSGGTVSSVTSNGVTSGKTSTGSGTTTTGNGVTSTVNGATSSASGAGGGQCSNPGTLHPPKADAGTETLYCPFSGVDGGMNANCDTATDHCCEYPQNGLQSGCEAKATPCDTTASVDWVCEDPLSDCGSGKDCCAPNASIGLGSPGCGNFAHTMKSTACVAKGTCTGIIMCTSDAECPPATPTCTPFSKAGAQVGGCM